MKIRKTLSKIPKEQEIDKKWYLIDAQDKILGRLASQVAGMLRGKHKPIFTPHLDTGDFIVVINASKVKTTGKKFEKKKYYHHTGYVGGIKHAILKDVMLKKPEEVIRMAVKNMLPKNKLGKKMFTKLHVYKDADHPHTAQKPINYEVKK